MYHVRSDSFSANETPLYSVMLKVSICKSYTYIYARARTIHTHGIIILHTYIKITEENNFSLISRETTRK